MPFLHLRYSAEATRHALPRDLATRVTALTTDILGKKPDEVTEKEKAVIELRG